MTDTTKEYIDKHTFIPEGSLLMCLYDFDGFLCCM